LLLIVANVADVVVAQVDDVVVAVNCVSLLCCLFCFIASFDDFTIVVVHVNIIEDFDVVDVVVSTANGGVGVATLLVKIS
jgi:hypothetical protein